MRTAKEIMKHFQKIENEIMRKRDGKSQTKYQVISLFKEIKTMCMYRVPMDPIVDILDDGSMEYSCPRCGSTFVFPEGSDISDYHACCNCGQVYYDLELEKENERFSRYLKGEL